MTRILAAVILVVSAFAAAADDKPVVVELFTSQGCSSCPPADELLAELAERDDIIALALHVDYWDYIGWKDEFADPAYGTRQRKYARQGGRRMVYTPQIIIGGEEHVEGARAMKILDYVDMARDRTSLVPLSLNRRGDQLTVRAPRLNGLGRPVEVHLVRYDPSRTVDILRGENRGRRLTYTNVVTSWRTVGTWDGKSPLSLTLDVSGRDRVAVIVQERGPGRVVASAALK